MRDPRFAIIVLAVLTSGCPELPITHGSDPEILPDSDAFEHTVQVRYLGVSGFLIRLGHDVVLTAPLYSNPGLLTEGLAPIFPDAGRIERFHPKRASDREEVEAILVGHAHYDHLMDVPWVFDLARAAGPKILGSVTMTRVLAPYAAPPSPAPPGFPPDVPSVPADALVALNDPCANYVDSRNCAAEDPSPKARSEHVCPPFPGTKGRPYVINERLQVSAFCARHPDQFPGLHQAPGCLAAPLEDLPRRAGTHYLEGEALVYLIDFLDSHGSSRFRIYYQDVPSDGSFGKVPQDVLNEHPVDLALLCVGNWNLAVAKDAPSIIGNLRPRHVILGHWEDFFKPQDRKLSGAPFQPVGRYVREVGKRMDFLKLGAANVVLPAPQVLKTYRISE